MLLIEYHSKPLFENNRSLKSTAILSTKKYMDLGDNALTTDAPSACAWDFRTLRVRAQEQRALVRAGVHLRDGAEDVRRKLAGASSPSHFRVISTFGTVSYRIQILQNHKTR